MLALGLAALVGIGIGAAAMAPRSTDASTAQACTRIVATQNAVELERSRYLVAELGCSVRGTLPVLGAAADAGTGLPHAGPPPPAYDLGDTLFTFLWGFLLSVALTLTVTWLLNRLTDPSRRTPDSTGRQARRGYPGLADRDRQSFRCRQSTRRHG